MKDALLGLHKGDGKTKKKPVIFCAWPDCNKTFHNRSEWARHEEAKHYCPYHWVCCLDVDPNPLLILESCFICNLGNMSLEHVTKHHQFENCLNKKPAFLRKDHLSQHMTGTHMPLFTRKKMTPATLSSLIAAWKTNNPAMSAVALHCGFCGLKSLTWETRQNHVCGRIRGDLSNSPACKSLWQLDRDFPVTNSRSSTDVASAQNA
jgi:hypothetical protein